MKVTEFEIGDIFRRIVDSDTYIWARISPKEMVALDHTNYGIDHIELITGNWATNYTKITFEELGSISQAVYLKHFPKEPEGCACDLTVIMQQGCQCGWMQKESQLK